MISTVSFCIHVKCVKGLLQMEKAVGIFLDKCSCAASEPKNEINVVWQGPPEVIHSSIRLKDYCQSKVKSAMALYYWVLKTYQGG